LADEVEVISAQVLAGVPHGFLGRQGGVSQGVIAGLNIGHGAEDDADAIAENRRRAVEAVLPGAELATVYQVHSPDVVEVRKPWPHDERPRADAMVSERPGLLLGVVTADCAPVLLADVEAGVVGAAHAGWRGATAGVTDQAIAAMISLGAKIERIAAAIGPSIAKASYEVDVEFADRILAEDPDNERFLGEGPAGKSHFDLEAYIVARLAAAGIRRIEATGLDTYQLEDRYYSYRRAIHRIEPTYGRQLSLIGLAS